MGKYSTLFVVMFGIFFSLMASVMINHVMPGGVKVIFNLGFWKFIARAAILGLTVILSGILFTHIYAFVNALETDGDSITRYLQVLLVIVLSASPWACYHIVRILLRPLAKEVIKWEGVLINIDTVFLIFYFSVVGILLLFYKLFHKT